MGPPSVPLYSQMSWTLLTDNSVSPRALTSSERLLPCMLPFAKLPLKKPSNRLPPSLGMKLISTPAEHRLGRAGPQFEAHFLGAGRVRNVAEVRAAAAGVHPVDENPLLAAVTAVDRQPQRLLSFAAADVHGRARHDHARRKRGPGARASCWSGWQSRMSFGIRFRTEVF